MAWSIRTCVHIYMYTCIMRLPSLPPISPFPPIPLLFHPIYSFPFPSNSPLSFPLPLHLQGVTGDPPHYTGKSPTTWDVRVFVQALQSLLPNLNWREVILYLDYPEFNLSSPEGLNLIVSAFKLATRDTFPVECFYLVWRNTRGHLSLLKQAIVGCPEFSVAQYPMVVMQLSDENKFNLNSEEAKTW